MNTDEQGTVFIKNVKRQFLKSTLTPVLIFSLAFILLFPVGSYLYSQQTAAQRADYLSAALSKEMRLCISAMAQPETAEQLASYADGRIEKLELYHYLAELFSSCRLISHFSLYQEENMLMSNQNYTLSGGGNPRILDSYSRYRMDHTSGMYYYPHFENQVSGDRVIYTIGQRFSFSSLPTLYLLIEMRESNFRALCSAGSNIILTNAYHRVMFQKTDQEYSFPDGRCTADFLRSNVQNVFSEAEAADGSIHVFAVHSMAATQYTLLVFLALLAVSAMISAVLFRLMSRRLYRSVYQSLASLFVAVDEFDKSHYNYQISVSTKDEMYPLIEQYNRILDTIRRLIERNNAYADETRIAQIKAVQSQFEPHFLYNTLEAIRYTIAEDSKTAQKMIVKLSRLMRYSISQKASSMTILREDMQYTKAYLDLQTLRLGNELSYEIVMDDEAGACRVPPLFIQPLIENSIKYGICFDRPLEIRINAHIEKNRLVCVVTDNGNGVSVEQLEKIRQSLNQENSAGHLGIYNANKRLKLLYKDHYRLIIDSIAQQYFTVRIELERQ
ncbi:MAG: histidine kinase [Clostridia bacterium]|nr:histidine kinase [Clostridia bacterium]